LVIRASAVWFAGPRQVEIRPEEVAPPGPHEVLVESVVSLVSAGTEMLVYRGETASEEEFALDRPGRAGAFPFPVKYGYQVVGRVAEVGAGAPYAEGDLVFARHPHQSAFTIPAIPVGGQDYVFPVPAGFSAEQAVFSNLMGVALIALLDSPVRVGENVAVSGLGIVGRFIAELCRRTAGRLILIDPMASRRALAADVGADAVVAPADAAAVIDELTHGSGVDLHFEASGAPAALQAAIATTAREGRITVVSNYGLRHADLVLSPDFHFKRLHIVSSQAVGAPPQLAPRWDRRRRVRTAMDLLADRDVSALGLRRVPLADAPAAYAALDRGDEGMLGVLLDYAAAASAAPAADL
jgi:2-desacetyl-2-hydroxyethyl bacteriochlorophyllide A dehydrogenase